MVGMTNGAIGGGGRRWRVALIGSLALNLLLAGIIGVWAVRPLFRGPPSPPEFGRVIERMAHRLDTVDAAMLRHAYEVRRDEITRLSRGVRDAREKVRTVLRAEPLDADALSRAMNDVRAARSAFEGALQDVMREGAVAMSVEGRHILARGPRGQAP